MSKKMEATFYDEAVNASNSQHDGATVFGFNPKTLKQTMTLNLNDPKHLKPQLSSKALDILTSPDVGLLKLASPELERLIIQSTQRLHALKEEPQTVPEMSGDTPPLSPIDMEDQERIKAERKRMRNRVAASKCRKRKLERIARLEDRVKNLKSQNTELVSSANVLRDELALLKQKVMDHVNSGCQLILTQQLQAF
ncbi:unnamed protein product, partial [Tetraodon nigroviridis]